MACPLRRHGYCQAVFEGNRLIEIVDRLSKLLLQWVASHLKRHGYYQAVFEGNKLIEIVVDRLNKLLPPGEFCLLNLRVHNKTLFAGKQLLKFGRYRESAFELYPIYTERDSKIGIYLTMIGKIAKDKIRNDEEQQFSAL
jgi:hypothetical protein